MKPFYERVDLQIWCGDCRDVLREMAPESVHLCVTSPPYLALRDYGIEPSIWGGEAECQHQWKAQRYYTEKSAAKASSEAFSSPGEDNAARLKAARWREDAFCSTCGAWRGVLGLEPSVDLYVAHLVEVFREVKRVLRKDGTLWLNLGSSYFSGKDDMMQLRDDLTADERAYVLAELAKCSDL